MEANEHAGHASGNSCNDYACNLSQYPLFFKAYDTDTMHLVTVIKRWWAVMFSHSDIQDAYVTA